MVSNCSGERSFSKLKFLKSHLRSCMTSEQLNSLALLNIETNVIRSIDMSFLINDFALKKSCKDNIYKESTFYMNENIHVNCSLQSLLATLNILPSTCIYYGAIYIFCLNCTLIVLLTSNFEIQYGFSLHLINSLFRRTGGARAPR